MDSFRKKNVLVIAGPTASGKSRLAMDMAQELGGEIINADSMQVYSPFPILTAQPSAEDKAAIPHHLFGYLTPPDTGSAAEWAQLARQKIDDVLAKGRLPIVVGGTGLYLEFLFFGTSDLPAIPQTIREQAKADFARDPENVLAILKKNDPDSAARLKPTDTQRIVRAYETWLATGEALSLWQKKNFKKPVHGWRPSFIILLPEREWLYARINSRFTAMLAAGAPHEALRAKEFSSDHPALKAVGVRELLAVKNGTLSTDAAIERAQTLSRNYAKRQYTWLRNRTLEQVKAADFPLFVHDNCDFTGWAEKSRAFLMQLG